MLMTLSITNAHGSHAQAILFDLPKNNDFYAFLDLTLRHR